MTGVPTHQHLRGTLSAGDCGHPCIPQLVSAEFPATSRPHSPGLLTLGLEGARYKVTERAGVRALVCVCVCENGP